MKRRRLLLLGPPLLLLLALLGAGLLCAPVRVMGSSMLPTLEDGERCLTLPLWLRPLRRGDLVVFREPDTGIVAVKRVAGLPGERIQLVDGDLFVDGRREQRPVLGVDDLIPLLDARGSGQIAAAFAVERSDPGPELQLDQESAWLRQVPLDGYLLDGRLHLGERPAADLGIEAEFRLPDPAAELDLLVREGPKIFRLQLAGERIQLLEGRQELFSMALPCPAPEGRLALLKVDQRVSISLNGNLLCPPVTFRPIRSTPPAEAPPGPPFEQAGIGGHGVILDRVRVGRDLYREPAGTFGCASALQLAEDEYFLLGDNPGSSRDSRHYGPVRSDRLLGRIGPVLLRSPLRAVPPDGPR